MKSLEFERCVADPQLFYRKRDGAMDLTHADDCRLTAAPTNADAVQEEIGSKMKIRWDRELGEPWTLFLGLLWRRLSPTFMQVKSDPRHLQQLLEIQNLKGAKPVQTPLWSSQLEQQMTELLLPADAKVYRTGVGILQWVALVRPDLQYSSKELARSLSQPNTRDKARLRKVTKYLLSTANIVLDLVVNLELDKTIIVYVDANFAAGESRKSTTGYVVLFQGMLLATASKTQSVIALSTAEAELLAANSGTQEGLFAQSILREVTTETLPIEVYTDSTSGSSFVHRQGLGRMRHIETRLLWLQQAVAERKVDVRTCSSADNLADVLTKQLPAQQLQLASRRLGLHPE